MHYIKLQSSDSPSSVGGYDVAPDSEVSRVLIPTSSGSDSQEEDGLSSILENLNVQQHLHEKLKPPPFENFEL